MNDVQQLVDALYKKSFGQLVASLLVSSRDIDPDTAEDIVQDSFAKALEAWRKDGVPLNAAGWIYRVCRNRALNFIKDQKTISLDQHNDPPNLEERSSESVLDDYTLRLLFACANPMLAPKIQVAITLKYVCNLKVEAIAKTLAMTVDGVDKLLLRARQRIRDEKMLISEPPPSALNARLASVHKVLYLLFNEGYKASWGPEILREELCEEALLATKSLLESPYGDKDTAALYALMLFNSARFNARFGSDGELVELENQDRTKWNSDIIHLATHYLNVSQVDAPTTYHLEASIAYLHCAAAHFDQTDWTMIAGLYQRLLKQQPNPFAELSYAIALYYADEKAIAFRLLDGLRRHPFIGQYYLLNATLGKLHQLEGNHEQAQAYFEKARRQTTFQKEQQLIQRKIDQMSDGS